ncbi:MAG TPA: protease pro-enzyme activation domain-containing protein, partial [Pirellulales bacterium]|nr:protease pro-enzyme activation domain-containing protein [Pirellulales bacterium]
MSPRKVFHDSVAELPVMPGMTPTGLKVNSAKDEHRDEKMTISFSLAVPKDAHDELEALVAQGKVVSPDELKTKYAVKPEAVKKLTDWLKGEGFEIEHVSSDGTSVYARASVGQIERSLSVTMVRVTKDGVTHTAARNAP